MHVGELFRNGRGQYREAIHFMAEYSRAPVITVEGDQDFRVQVILPFYVPEAAEGKEVRYYESKSLPNGGAEWFICRGESEENPVPPQPRGFDKQGNAYQWVKTFPSAPLSGQHWFIYHNEKP